MCTYHVKIDDAVLERAKPYFSGSAAMQLWIEQQLQKVLIDYTRQFEPLSDDKQDSNNILTHLQAIKGERDAFFKLCGILGKPNATFSWEQLREEAIEEKYMI